MRTTVYSILECLSHFVSNSVSHRVFGSLYFLMVSLGLHSHYTFVYELLQGNKKYFVVVEYASIHPQVFLTLTNKVWGGIRTPENLGCSQVPWTARPLRQSFWEQFSSCVTGSWTQSSPNAGEYPSTPPALPPEATGFEPAWSSLEWTLPCQGRDRLYCTISKSGSSVWWIHLRSLGLPSLTLIDLTQSHGPFFVQDRICNSCDFPLVTVLENARLQVKVRILPSHHP